MSNESNNNDLLSNVKNWISENPVVFVGIIAGIIIIILLFAIGLIKTIVVILLLLAGYWFGKNKDSGGAFTKFLSKIFKNNE